jgi:hypothetical protein
MVSLTLELNTTIDAAWLASACPGTGIGFVPLDDADQQIEKNLAFGGRKRLEHSAAEAALRGVYTLI